MSQAKAELARIIADVEATILYWRNRGVGVTAIGAELRVRRDWSAVRATMIAIEINRHVAAEIMRQAA